jgi:peptidoglycan/xylan/chitin deacetylase (PgdA/CDA1 family)
LTAVTLPVLLYHSIADAALPGLDRFTVPPAEFRAQLDVIASCGRRPVTMSELAECLRSGRRPERDVLAVTIDDGYADTPAAVRALLDNGVSATVYVTTGSLGDEGMLSRAQLGELAGADGVEIGAHTVSHPYLDELSGPALEAEVAGSGRALEEALGAPVASFAYPHGSHDRRARAAVVAAGYRSGAAIKNAISHLDDDPFAIARWTVTAGTSPERIARILRGEGAPLAWRRERLRTRAFRAVRRARRRLR